MNQPYRPNRPPAPAQPAHTSTGGKAPVFLIVDLIPVRTSGNLKAFVSVQVGPLTIHKLRLICQPGQAPWVSPPQESWTDRTTGETKWKALLDFPQAWKSPLTNAVIAAWEEHQRQNGGV